MKSYNKTVNENRMSNYLLYNPDLAIIFLHISYEEIIEGFQNPELSVTSP